MTDGEPKTAVSASLQKIKLIKIIKNNINIFYFIKSHTSDSFINHFDGHFTYLKVLDFSFKNNLALASLKFCLMCLQQNSVQIRWITALLFSSFGSSMAVNNFHQCRVRSQIFHCYWQVPSWFVYLFEQVAYCQSVRTSNRDWFRTMIRTAKKGLEFWSLSFVTAELQNMLSPACKWMAGNW